jgi:long-chain fatty acid transport protein
MNMRKSEKLFCYILLGGLSITTLPASANVIQFFFGSNYKNPAELSTTPYAQATLGATGVNPVMHFKGTSAGGTGTASSDESDVLPYFYGGFRLSPKWVVGLNISHPFYGTIRYPENSILAIDSTQTITRDIDYNPQISYQATKNLSIGVGYNLNNYYDSEVNFVIPGLGNAENKASGWYNTWDIGAFYTLTPQDYIGLSYFSALEKTLTGTSRVGNMVNHNFQVENFNLPATTELTYLHIFNRQWAINFKAFYSQWSRLQEETSRNVVVYGTFSAPVHYRNTFAAELGARYAFAPDWAVLGGVGFDQGASNDFSRTLSYPTDDAYAGALGLEHAFCKNLSSTLMYTYVTADTHVNHPLGISPTVGDIDIHANLLDLSLTYKI